MRVLVRSSSLQRKVVGSAVFEAMALTVMATGVEGVERSKRSQEKRGLVLSALGTVWRASAVLIASSSLNLTAIICLYPRPGEFKGRLKLRYTTLAKSLEARFERLISKEFDESGAMRPLCIEEMHKISARSLTTIFF